MAVFNNSSEGGTNGTAVTNANSGGASGDAWTAVEAGVAFRNDWAAHGALSFGTNAQSASAIARWASGGTDKNTAIRVYHRHTVAATSDQRIIDLRSGANTVVALLQGTDRLRLTTSSSGTLWTSTNALPTDARIELIAEPGTTTSNGKVRIAYYTGDSTTATEDSGDITGNVLGQGNVDNIRFGAAGAYTGNFRFDDVAVRTGADYSGFIGPVANTAPTVSVTANQNVSAAATVNVTATASDPDGSIASYAWTYDFPASGGPTLTGGTTAAASFTAGSAGALYVLRCTVTDNGGATAFATTEVRVPLTGATENRPIASDGTGATWTNTGGAATQGAALADSSDTTYVETPTVSGTETAHRWRYQPSNAKGAANVALRLATDSGTANVAVRLYEGTTLRQSWSQALTTTITDYTFSLSGGTIGAISDFGNLFIEVGATT